jgi:hypothetical protein
MQVGYCPTSRWVAYFGMETQRQAAPLRRFRHSVAEEQRQEPAPATLADGHREALEQVVALVGANRAGLRSEQIRAALHMQAKEMPRVLKEGLTKRVLRSSGQKRSTTYTAT